MTSSDEQREHRLLQDIEQVPADRRYGFVDTHLLPVGW